MPTSLNERLLAVATPLAKLPPATVPLLSAPVAPAPGNTSVRVSSTPSATVSRPKFGVAAPPEVTAVTVALKLSPALTKAAPVAPAAAGLARLGLAVWRMPLSVKPAGRVTNAFDAPVSGAEFTVLLAYSVTWPTSLKVKVKGALPLASKLIGTAVLLATLPLLLRWIVVALPAFTLIRLAAAQVSGLLHS